MPAPAAEWNVTEFGAAGDGKADCTTAFQKASDTAYEAGGGVVRVPTGKFRFDGNLVIPSAVTLQGTYEGAPSGYHDPGHDFEGSTLQVYAGRGSTEGKPFIHLAGRMAALAGFMIEYPESTIDKVPPAPYPPCVFGNEWDIVIKDCCILNAYQAVVLYNAGRHLLRNVHGYPTKLGIRVDYNRDVGRIENCHFSPRGFEFDPKGKYMQWVFKNGTAFEFAHSDWQYVTNTFCFGYRIGYRFMESKDGCSNGNYLGIGADCCYRPLLVEQASPVGLLITNGEFVGQWHTTDSTCVDIAPECKGRVNLTNCSFWGPNDRLIHQRAPRAHIIATACNFVEWDNDHDNSPAIQIDAGRAIIQGCSFDEGASHMQINPKAGTVTLIGNQAPNGLRVDNKAGKRTIMIGNEPEDSRSTDQP